MSHVIAGALLAAREYLLEATNHSTYGYYPGGDPRDFCPDGECCTPEELAAHKAACEAWERGDRTKHEAHHHTVSQMGEAIVSVSHAGAFGIGVYSMRDEAAEDILEQIDAALASLNERRG